MTNIIELARQAGAETQDGGKHWEFDDFDIAKFAELIRADEREACAKVCEETGIVEYVFGGQTYDDAWNTLMVAAAAIRARGGQV